MSIKFDDTCNMMLTKKAMAEVFVFFDWPSYMTM